MIDIIGIITVRDIKKNNYRDIVYEWEDEIVEKNNLCMKRLRLSIRDRVFNKLKLHKNYDMYTFNPNESVYLAFVLAPKELSLISKYNCIPILIDVWPCDINFVFEKMKRNLFVVTSYDSFQLLKQRGSNVLYAPLSIADQWRLNEIPEKTVDIVQMGRKNSVLHDYALRYVSAHEGTEYIYSEYDESNKRLSYYSTVRGRINTPESRTDYMNFLKMSKVCLVSSPGCDNSRSCAEGIDYPTPRFYETAINYCNMLGRYGKEHIEFEMMDIPKVCYNVQTFDEFEKELEDILIHNKTIDKETYDQFINAHLTSVWYKKLIENIQEKYKETGI